MKRPLLVLGTLFLYLHSISQTGPGLLSSNYCGVSTVKFNPAIADNNLNFDMSLGGAYLTTSNNFAGVNYSSFFGTPFKTDYLSADVFPNSLFWAPFNTPFRTPQSFSFYKSAELQGPGSFMVNFGKNKENALAFGYNYNVVKNFWTSDANFIMNGSDSSKTFSSAKFSLKSLTWIDIDATYSRVLWKNPQHMLKGGITLKGIIGMGAVNVSSDNFSSTGGGTVYGDASSGMFVNGEFTKAAAMGSPALSPGFGTDIGFVYEWRPKIKNYYYEMDGDTANVRNDIDLYTLRVAFSATDLGFISLNQNPFSSSLPDAMTLRSVPVIDSLAGAPVPGNSKSVSQLLPMRFNISLDYNIAKGFGLNLMARISPFNNDPTHISHPSELIFTPRFDIKWFGFYIPLSYDFNNSNVALGVAARLGPVFFGFDNLIGLGAGGAFKGGIYGGVKIPIFYHKPKDRDGDKVSDKVDKCPDLFGTWSARGCPDQDGDGVLDADDQCPTQPGPALTHGCPDRDNDGVADKDDRCPDEPGPPALLGCPDRDGDGVADIDDSCPDVKGEIRYHGCPDTDGDGVPDYKDKCPTVFGPPEHRGCPDSDSDGVFDDEDNCPTIPGPVANKGCPYEDSDNDGVPDNEDKCPLEPGPKENFGCPKRHIPQISQLEQCRDTLLFDVGSVVLTQLNVQKLTYIVKELKKNTSDNVKILGYTDSTETEAVEALSRGRAVKVREYLIDNGIDALRITFDGWGSENPVGDNKTWSGKRKNRRVEIYYQIAANN